MSNPLQSALETLTPIDWSSVPVDDLKTYMRNAFNESELIANSVPQFPDGDPFEQSKTIPGLASDSAKSSADVQVSDARLPDPKQEHESLQKHWGKPVKVAASSNALGMTVWKMAGADRHGAWFARRSVHEGMGFSRWKLAMQGEFAASVGVSGGPGAGAIRGVGADARLENQVVEGLGRLEVWQLSAQFPKPVSSREFVTLVLTTDQGLQHQPTDGRYYMVVSIPVEHPATDSNAGLVRGNYESVEMIRELPLVKNKEGQKDADIESNPVEWLMVTRSDPGGGIPRFLVERNTPASITADAKKFVDWAAKGDNIPSEDEIAEKKKEADVAGDEEKGNVGGEESASSAPSGAAPPKTTPAAAHQNSRATAGPQPLGTDESLTASYERAASPAPAAPAAASTGGYLASLTGAVQSGIDSYVPDSVQSRLPAVLLAHPERYADDTDTSDDDSISSFESAHSRHHHVQDQNHLQVNRGIDTSSSETSSLAPPAHIPDATASAPDLRTTATNEDSAIHPSVSAGSANSLSSTRKANDKDLAKLMAKRRSLAEKYTAQEAKDSQRQREISESVTKESEKKQRQLDKERRKNHDKYMREIAKIEERQRKEERKAERKMRKEEDESEMMRLGRLAEEAHGQTNELRAENEALKAQLGSAQAQLTALIREVGLLSSGAEVLEKVRIEVGDEHHSRASMALSRKSGESIQKS